MTNYIARVNSEGDPESMWTTGVTPDMEEGPDPSDSTKTIVHVTADLVDTASFIANHYYKEGVWLSRNERPGDYYDWKDGAWALNSDRLWVDIRYKRSAELYVTDWTQAADSPLTDCERAEWALYRIALREIPVSNSGATRLEEVVWPEQPN